MDSVSRPCTKQRAGFLTEAGRVHCAVRNELLWIIQDGFRLQNVHQFITVLKYKGAHGFSNMDMSLCMYLCVTNTVLLSIKINEVQDELRRFQRVLRLFDKIGAENFISGVGNRIFKDQVNKINNLLESDTAGLLLRSLSLSTNRKDISVITSHQLQKNGNP